MHVETHAIINEYIATYQLTWWMTKASFFFKLLQKAFHAWLASPCQQADDSLEVVLEISANIALTHTHLEHSPSFRCSVRFLLQLLPSLPVTATSYLFSSQSYAIIYKVCNLRHNFPCLPACHTLSTHSCFPTWS